MQVYSSLWTSIIRLAVFYVLKGTDCTRRCNGSLLLIIATAVFISAFNQQKLTVPYATLSPI
jgi:hypothetical protein